MANSGTPSAVFLIAAIDCVGEMLWRGSRSTEVLAPNRAAVASAGEKNANRPHTLFANTDAAIEERHARCEEDDNEDDNN